MSTAIHLLRKVGPVAIPLVLYGCFNLENTIPGILTYFLLRDVLGITPTNFRAWNVSLTQYYVSWGTKESERETKTDSHHLRFNE